MRKEGQYQGRADALDLQTQLESFFDQGWHSEANWHPWDRIDAMVPQRCREVEREQRDPLRPPKPGA